MRISEIFYSIQGEGELTGVPSVFVRTSGCNLRCAWCDTPYASWTPTGHEMSVASVLEEVQKFPARHCVLTGGEPMVARNVRELAAGLHVAGWHITIETAGTIAPDGIPCDLASISPKLANSTPLPGTIETEWIERHERLRLQPEILRAWMENYSCQLKFVISSAGDVPAIDSLIASIGIAVPPWKILLMPEGTSEAAMRDRQADVLAVCRERGFRYCDRLHIRLFGNTRGT